MHFEKEKKTFVCFFTSLKMKGAYFYFTTEPKHIILQLELCNSVSIDLSKFESFLNFKKPITSAGSLKLSELDLDIRSSF